MEEMQEAQRRLDRLEGFLRQDSDNAHLLADAFEAALFCREWDRADAHLRQAQAKQPGDAAWALREGDFWLAQQRYSEARDVLERLAAQAEPGAPLAAVVAHNLAFIDFQQGAYAACAARLEPWVTAPAQPGNTSLSALQQLWLRALHRAGELARAMTWAAQTEQAGALDPAAAGIAALIAIDEEDFAAAQRWSQAAQSGQQPPTLELLVAQATLALAAGDAPAAQQWADRALQLHPRDGRAWSARAFGSLLAGDLARAARDFEQALAYMPEHIGTWHGQGWAQVLQRDFAAAQASFESALALDRNFAESHGGLAVALALQKQTTAAQQHIELAERLDRGNLSSRYARAILSGEAQDARAVQQLARRLLGGRKAPMGGQMADWLPPEKPSRESGSD
jgi:tetratricopeptide (TPR) repeat protein